MYDWQVKLFSKEKLYLAGPECFYTNGYTLWLHPVGCHAP